MSFFLRIRTWELAAIFYLLIVLRMMLPSEPLPSLMNKVLVYIAPIPPWLWLWAIAVEIPKNYSVNLKKAEALFKSIMLVGLVVWIIPSFMLDLGVLPNLVINILLIVLVVWVYSYAARVLKSAEMKKDIPWSEALTEFFLIWIYPIGVWIIQPRVNKLYESVNGNATSD